MEYGWIWIAVLVLAILVEIFTEQLVSVWFVPASTTLYNYNYSTRNPVVQAYLYGTICNSKADLFRLRNGTSAGNTTNNPSTNKYTLATR